MFTIAIVVARGDSGQAAQTIDREGGDAARLGEATGTITQENRNIIRSLVNQHEICIGICVGIAAQGLDRYRLAPHRPPDG
jgi:hypothetical protein